MDTWNAPFCDNKEQDFNCDKKAIMVTLSNENSAQRALNSFDISRPRDTSTNNTSNRNCCST